MAIRCQALWEHQTNFNRDRCVTQTVKLICIFLKPFFFFFSHLLFVGVQQVILPIDAHDWQSQMCCFLQNVLVGRCSPSDKDHPHHWCYRAGCQLEIYRALIFIGPIIAKSACGCCVQLMPHSHVFIYFSFLAERIIRTHNPSHSPKASYWSSI